MNSYLVTVLPAAMSVTQIRLHRLYPNNGRFPTPTISSYSFPGWVVDEILLDDDLSSARRIFSASVFLHGQDYTKKVTPIIRKVKFLVFGYFGHLFDAVTPRRAFSFAEYRGKHNTMA